MPAERRARSRSVEHGGARVPRTRSLTRDIDKPETVAFRRALGGNLRALRRCARLSQSGLAARCFMREGRVSELERGRTTPTVQELLLLADALDVSVGELTEGLVTPTRTAGRARILALVAEQPEITIGELAASSGLPHGYVFEVIPYLEAWGILHRQSGRWQLGEQGAARPGRGRAG